MPEVGDVTNAVVESYKKSLIIQNVPCPVELGLLFSKVQSLNPIIVQYFHLDPVFRIKLELKLIVNYLNVVR